MEQLHLLKIGGRLIEQENQLKIVLAHFLRKKGHKILVHGGGNRASELGKNLAIPVKMIEGRRITDGATLEIVTMVYAGLINKRIVSLLQSMNGNAIGLSGADGNVIRACKRMVKDVDYGFVGDIDKVNIGFIKVLLESETLPVFCALTHDGKGQLLNTNADTIAATLSRALSDTYAVHCYFCLEKNGVLSNPKDDASVLNLLSRSNFHTLKIKGIITNGMIPKLDNGFEALEKGVSKVVVCGPDTFLSNHGTQLTL